MSEEQLIATPALFGENNNFMLERELGKGGMGGVYMGRDKMLDRPVAVKVMQKQYGEDPAFVEKFKKEAQAAARLIHPNIAQIYSYGIANNMPYIAMELVAGGSLEQIMLNCEPGTTDIPRVMKIGEQVAQALRCAADQGLVHGDIKPENILLDSNGNAKIVDFGLAAMQQDTTEIWGTPYYIAPEKVKKEHVDYRADMYSLGGTLYHVLTGSAPFEGDDANAVVRKRFEGAPKKPSEVRPGLSPQIDKLIMTMLAFKPGDRFPSFEALLNEFKKVMATGLTEVAAAAPTSATTTSGGKKLVLKGKKKFKVTKASSAPAPAAPAETEATGAKVPKIPSRIKLKPHGKGSSSGSSDGGSAPAEPQQGGVGGKVALTIGGTIALIGAVLGALVWYQVHDANVRAAEKQAQIEAAIQKAKGAVVDTREKARAFQQEFDTFAVSAIDECQKPTDDLVKVLSQHFDDDIEAIMKPGPSKELLDAIALTNQLAAASEEASGEKKEEGLAPTEAPAKEKKAPAAPAAAAPAASGSRSMAAAIAPAEPPKFRDPTEDEADPMSPEHETYLRAKTKWEAEQKVKMEQAAEAKASAPAASTTTTAAAPAAASSKKPASGGSKLDLSMVIRDMHELWEKAYSCQAGAIRLHVKIDELMASIDAAERIEGNDEATMEKLAAFSREVVDSFEIIKASDEVTKVKKAIGFIKAKGAKTVQQTVNRLIIEAAEKKRAEEKAAAEAADKERQEKKAADKEAEIAQTSEQARKKFDSFVESGMFRQLDWKGAIRQLQTMRDDFRYSEAQQVADLMILKVKMMQSVQDVIVANAKGHVMKRGLPKGDKNVSLKNCKISQISMTDSVIIFTKADGKGTIKISWKKFYQEYHGNLNELIVKYIEKGKDVSKTTDGKNLNLQRWAEAMMGAALTMQIICNDDPAAIVRGEQIAKEAVSRYPDYLKHAQEIFPNIDFSGVETE